MAFAWSISCTGCRFAQMAGLDAYAIYYWLGGDRFAPMPFVGAWCGGCRMVTLAEEVPDAAVLAERADWWLRFFRERGSGPGDVVYDRTVREFAAQRDWRAVRVGPPRCLLCRSAGVAPLDLSVMSPPEVPHPGCRGRLRFDRGWHFHTRSMWVYSVEGEFLGFGSGFEGFSPPPAPLPPGESGLRYWVAIGSSGTAGASAAPGGRAGRRGAPIGAARAVAYNSLRYIAWLVRSAFGASKK